MRRSVLDKARHGGHVTQKDVGEGEAARLHEGGGEGGLAQAPHLVTPNVEAGTRVNLYHLVQSKASGSIQKYSFADPGCLSRIRLCSIPDPGSELSPSQIPDLGSASKKVS
jgi:hypothetical protein